MFRKLILAAGATAAIAAAALTPTAASAWGWHGHGHWYGHGYRVGFYGPAYVAAPNCYVVRRTFELPDGSLRVRRVTVCD
jgi:hypothetical protein